VRDLREAITYSHSKGDKVMLMAAFDRGISVFDSLGLAEPAAVLAGVALHGPLAVLSILPQAERDDRAVLLEQVRTLIGRTAHEHAVAQGAAMNDDEAITYALDQLDTAETQSLAQSAARDAQRPTAKGTSSARRSAKRSQAGRR
jgi:hypothetical protein